MDGISPGLQSEVNLYRKYKDFEEAGWDIMAGVRLSFCARRRRLFRISHPPSRIHKVSVLPSAEVTLFLADPVVVKVRTPDARQLPAMSSRITLPLLPARRTQ